MATQDYRIWRKTKLRTRVPQGSQVPRCVIPITAIVRAARFRLQRLAGNVILSGLREFPQSFSKSAKDLVPARGVF